MIHRIPQLLILVFLLCGCSDVGNVDNNNRTRAKEITYSYACIDSAVSGGKMNRDISKATDLVRNIAVSKKSVTDEMQTEYGRIFHEQMIKEGGVKLLNNPELSKYLDGILTELLEARTDPSGIKYQIYPLDDSNINAFTFGGRIYVTKAMLEQCKHNKELIYSIIGHEIGHNEVGHIRAAIQGMILSDKLFGHDYGNTAFALSRFLTASFNQRKELEADYYGINLTYALGHDVCSAVLFWKEMASKENSYSEVEDFFRTHPFSKFRAQCLMDHIANNFGKDCGALDKSNLLPQVVNDSLK